MKLNEELCNELKILHANAVFHSTQLTDAIRRAFLALGIPLESRLSIETGEITLPEKQEDPDQPLSTDSPQE